MTDFHNFSPDSAPTVLIVDDMPLNLQVISTALKQQGYRLIITNSAENALKVLEQTIPDLILLDVMMPGMSGFELCRILKKDEALQHIPVIFLTAKNELDDLMEGFDAGAVDYIVKPYHASEVFVRISTHIQLKQAREKLLEQTRIIEQDALRLARLNAEKNRFFSIIAHDLRGPFTGLIGLSKMLKTDVDTLPPASVRQLAGMIFESSNQVFELLENLLDWSRVQMDAISFSPVSQPLLPVAESIRKQLNHHIELKELELKLEISEATTVRADTNMLKTILRNLLTNAVKFTPRGGRIIISATTNETGATVISVADTGIGIGPEMIDTIFRLDQKSSRPGTEGEISTGLGLLLCKEFAEKHGGEIRVESQVAVGSVFSVIFP